MKLSPEDYYHPTGKTVFCFGLAFLVLVEFRSLFLELSSALSFEFLIFIPLYRSPPSVIVCRSALPLLFLLTLPLSLSLFPSFFFFLLLFILNISLSFFSGFFPFLCL